MQNVHYPVPKIFAEQMLLLAAFKIVCRHIYFIYIIDLVWAKFQPCFQERFNVKSVLVACVGCVFEIGVFGDVVLIRKERTHTTQLEDALAAVHNGKFVLAHQLSATMSSDEFKNGQKNNPSRLREGSYDLNTNTINTVYESINYLKQ